MSDDSDTLSVSELTEYCQTQARLLAGRTETLAAEIDELLDEIDEDIADMRERLTTQSTGPNTATGSAGTTAPNAAEEVTQLEKLETELEEKQAVAEAKRARISVFQDLSETYAELAADLDAAAVDGQDALEQIVTLEQNHDAPAYFDDRQTLLEVVAESDS
jgi:chromosome segregation ATPase